LFRTSVALLLVLLAALVSCVQNAAPAPDPFSAAPVPIDGVSRDLGSNIVNLGPLETGRVIRVRLLGPGIETVLMLRQDGQVREAGLVVGGGRPEGFDYRIPADGVYAVLVHLDPEVDTSGTRISIGDGDPDFRPPREQFVVVAFAPGYLSEPGMFDPESMTPEDQQLFASLAEPVKQSVLTELHRIFDGTPVRILSESDPLPDAPVSRLTYRPDRVVSEDQTTIDAALPPPDPTRPECLVRVDFGEVLPHGTGGDAGNREFDDEAVVYVGSFQGRGATCQTAVINSLNNMVLSLAQTGAHEIGHLIGLLHVEQLDIMNPTATLAFLREMSLRRGQIQLDRIINGQRVGEVVTNVVQDPEIYFRSAFDASP
jgi:hypothetical protein